MFLSSFILSFPYIENYRTKLDRGYGSITMSTEFLEKIACPLKLAFFCCSILLFCGCSEQSSSEPPKDEKYKIPDGLSTVSTYAEALEVAGETQKKVMVLFTKVDFRRNCKLMVSKIIHTPEFALWAKENVVFLAYDHSYRAEVTSEGVEVARKLKRNSYPVSIFVNSNGEILGRMNYRPGDPEVWIAAANEILNKKASKASSD